MTTGMLPFLLPFPGPTPEGLVAGITPPAVPSGSWLDLADPATALPGLVRGGLLPGWRAYWVRQVHGTDVVEAPTLQREGGLIGTADALVTQAPEALLLTRHADCPPLLVWDPVHRAVGLAHSGRRGTLANIAGVLVDSMRGRFGSSPERLVASIGPGIRACCYEIGPEVLRGIPPETVARRLSRTDGKLFFDTHRMIADQLRDAGVRTVYGAAEAECTLCGPTRLHSYRRDGTRLRFAAVAGILPV